MKINGVEVQIFKFKLENEWEDEYQTLQTIGQGEQSYTS
jgi:hypothetical protein